MTAVRTIWSVRVVSPPHDVKRLEPVARDAPPCCCARSAEGASGAGIQDRRHGPLIDRVRGSNQPQDPWRVPLPVPTVEETLSLVAVVPERAGLLNGYETALRRRKVEESTVVDHVEMVACGV